MQYTTPTPVTIYLNAVADATISSLYPTRNYGQEESLAVSISPSETQIALVRFDLSPLPAITSLRYAVLRLNLQQSTGPELARITAVQATSDWQEDRVTWATQPATGAYTATVAVGTEPGERGWSVTGLVRAWLAGTAPNQGILVYLESPGGSRTFGSRESDTPPRLELSLYLPTPTTTSTPSPTVIPTRTTTPTPISTGVQLNTPTPTLTATPTPTNTGIQLNTPTMTPTATRRPASPTPRPPATPTPNPTPTPEPATPAPTLTPAPVFPTSTPTGTPTPTSTDRPSHPLIPTLPPTPTTTPRFLLTIVIPTDTTTPSPTLSMATPTSTAVAIPPLEIPTPSEIPTAVTGTSSPTGVPFCLAGGLALALAALILIIIVGRRFALGGN